MCYVNVKNRRNILCQLDKRTKCVGSFIWFFVNYFMFVAPMMYAEDSQVRFGRLNPEIFSAM